MGDHRLRDRLRRLPAPRRAPRRPPGAPPRLRRRHRALHVRLGPQRPSLVGRLARRLPRAPRTWRCALRACRALAPHDHLPRRPGAEHRARHLGRCVGQRRGRRRPPRRRLDLIPLLALDLLHQRAGRARARRAHSALPRGEPWRAHREALRHSRSDLDHGVPDGARLRADARDPARLGERLHGCAAEHRGGACRGRSLRSSDELRRRSCRSRCSAARPSPRRR